MGCWMFFLETEVRMKAKAVTDVLLELDAEIRSKYSQRISKISRRFDIDDLVQSTALRALRGAKSCRAETVDELRGWVMTIVKRTMLTAFAREIGASKRSILREAGEAELSSLSQDGLFLDTIEAAEELERELLTVQELIATLPGRQAQAIRLRYLEQLEYCEIAEKMNATTLAVRSLVSKGLAKIRQGE